jgi:YggT family protein
VLYTIIYYVLLVFEIAILARVLLSWFPNLDRNSPVIQLVYQITEPVLKPIRNLLPNTGGFDFSPLVVLLLISVLMQVLARIL